MSSLTKCLKDHRDIILVGHVIKSHEDESLFRGIDHIPIQSYWSDIVCQNTTPTSAPSGAWTHNLWNPLSLQLASIALITRPYRQDTHRYRMFVKQTRAAFTALSKIHITHFGNVWYIAIVYMYWTVLLQHSWQRILKLPVQETLADIFDTNMQINFDNKMYNIIHLYNKVLKFSYLNYQITAN